MQHGDHNEARKQQNRLPRRQVSGILSGDQVDHNEHNAKYEAAEAVPAQLVLGVVVVDRNDGLPARFSGLGEYLPVGNDLQDNPGDRKNRLAPSAVPVITPATAASSVVSPSRAVVSSVVSASAVANSVIVSFPFP